MKFAQWLEGAQILVYVDLWTNLLFIPIIAKWRDNGRPLGKVDCFAICDFKVGFVGMLRIRIVGNDLRIVPWLVLLNLLRKCAFSCRGDPMWSPVTYG